MSRLTRALLALAFWLIVVAVVIVVIAGVAGGSTHHPVKVPRAVPILSTMPRSSNPRIRKMEERGLAQERAERPKVEAEHKANLERVEREGNLE
jgi:hypothetical protein